MILPNCEVTRNFEEKPHTAVHLLSSSTAKCTSAAQYSVVAAEKRRGGHVESKNENIVICSIVYVPGISNRKRNIRFLKTKIKIGENPTRNFFTETVGTRTVFLFFLA